MGVLYVEARRCECEFCRAHVHQPIPTSQVQRDLMLRAYGYCWLPRLEEVRISKGWSRGSLAQAVDVSYDYLAAVENGRHRTRNILARRLADVLEVSVSELEGEA